MFRFARRGAIEYIEAEELSKPGLVIHAFCGRREGESEGPFSSLNTGFLVGDREADVRRNLIEKTSKSPLRSAEGRRADFEAFPTRIRQTS